LDGERARVTKSVSINKSAPLYRAGDTKTGRNPTSMNA
jgi:hypothetical protein